MYQNYKSMRAAPDTRVLVTGASGYIATHIVKQLQGLGYKVRGTVRSLNNEVKIKPLRKLCPGAKYPLELVEADLTSESGWVEAVTGCTYVMHTASPFTLENPEDENVLVRPAVDGTLNVLKACQKVGGVKRVVLTSSCAAITGPMGEEGRTFTEADWTNLDTAPAYYKSKTLAEKAAWDFMKKLPEKDKFELAVINPFGVMGPALCGTPGTSMQIIMMLLLKSVPLVPKMSIGIVDVRDVAQAHIVAMTKAEAAGNRYALNSRMMTIEEIAKILNKEFSPKGYDIPTELVSSDMPYVSFDVSSAKAKKELGIQLRPTEESLIDMANSLIESGLIKKTGRNIKVLVTGASGYIATHVVKQLQELGYQVRGTVRSTKNEEKVGPLKNLCPDAKYPLELVEADLTSESGWVEAVTGCTYVLHTASPFTIENPEDENVLIRPAVDGTLNVLKACQKVGGVKRVVLTSSCAAITGMGEEGKIFTEKDWTDVNTVTAYYKSKTLAEKAAWEFLKDLPEKDKFELVVINPAGVMGPVLCGTPGASMQIIMSMLLNAMPTLPKMRVGVIDVRDVALAHIVAMNKAEAVGNRFILSSQMMGMEDVADIFRKEFGPQGYVIPEAAPGNNPYVMYEMDNSQLRNILGIEPRSTEESLIDMAYSLIEKGFVKKTEKYVGPGFTKM